MAVEAEDLHSFAVEVNPPGSNLASRKPVLTDRAWLTGAAWRPAGADRRALTPYSFGWSGYHSLTSPASRRSSRATAGPDLAVVAVSCSVVAAVASLRGPSSSS